MERILVVMKPANTNFLAGIHALNLAKRISAKVFFLLIFPYPPRQSGPHTEGQDEATLKRGVEGLIDEARSDGITVDYYTAYGNYESELVGFVQEKKVTLLVVENEPGQGNHAQRSKELLDKLHHRINCRIEVVNEKPNAQERKD
ncbi:MAG: hypothetical protein KKB20_16740 [Proteobacteria bacterium]|nr:hypothetical protein [Pseudomonadota bacterium]